MNKYWDYIDLYKIALKDYDELKDLIENKYKGLTLEQVYEELYEDESLLGMNYCYADEDLFDINYKSICATIQQDENGKVYLSETIEIYDNNEGLLGDFWTYILRKDIERFENGEIRNYERYNEND